MAISKNGLGVDGVVGAVALLALGGVAACGSDFSGDDCRVTHTCSVAAGASVGGQPDDEAGGMSSDDSNAGGDTSASGGVGAASGADQGGAEAGGAPIAVNAPPSVVSVTPASGMTDVDPAAPVVITFSEPLAEASVTPESVKLLDGDQAVPGKLSYADGTVTFVPDAPLGLLASYEISVATSVTDEQGAGLPLIYSSKYRVRDGAWHTVNAVTDTLLQIAQTLPVAANGDALLSWISVNKPGYYCPTSAAWFNRSKPATASVPLTGLDVQDCRSVAAAATADGLGVVVWQEEVEYAQQYRGGEWAPEKATVSQSGGSTGFAVGLAPDGSASFFQHFSASSVAYRSDANGKWIATPDELSKERGLSAPTIAFNGRGKGFAAWRARDAQSYENILVSEFEAGVWQSAKVVPGSTAALAGADYQRGTPAIAVDATGNALVLWVRESGPNQSALMVNRFAQDAGTWGAPVVISGSVLVKPVVEPPALVFDGQTFVAAWVGQDDTAPHIYAARFDMDLNQFGPFEQRSPLPIDLMRMPRLGADAHQNLLLTWAKFRDGGATLIFQRYDAENEAWSLATEIPGGTVKDTSFASSGAMPLGINASGLGAMMWVDENDEDVPSTLRLASFY